jgi:uncharacterized membrane protein YhdT
VGMDVYRHKHYCFCAYFSSKIFDLLGLPIFFEFSRCRKPCEFVDRVIELIRGFSGHWKSMRRIVINRTERCKT